MNEKRLIGVDEIVRNVTLTVVADNPRTGYGASEVINIVRRCASACRTVPAVALPCDYGAKLYKVTKPYRQEKQATEFIVVNFRTAGKKHVLQVEVRVNGLPGTNWMPFSKFKESREEAEAALRRKAE